MVARVNQTKPVYLTLDLSNVASAAKKTALLRGMSQQVSESVRVFASGLRQLVQRDRRWISGYAAWAMANPGQNRVETVWRAAGIELETFELGAWSRREIAVDLVLQGHLRTLLAPRCEPGVVCLVGGDGAGHLDGRGFIPALEDLRSFGHHLEVMSFRCSLNGALSNWAKKNGSLFELDNVFPWITFEEQGRRALPITPQVYALLGRENDNSA